MTTLTQSQIKLYAAAAGFTNPSLMAAIAMAESTGRADVVNSIGCVGLWQINQPVWVKDHPSWTQAWLKDPAHNAAAAKVVYNAQGLTAWQAYTNGAYQKFYTGTSSSGTTATTAGLTDIPGQIWDGTKWIVGGTAGSLTGSVPGLSAVTDTATAIEDVAKAGWAAGKWISTPNNWLRIAYVVGGGVLTVVALNLIVQSTVLKKVTGGGSAADTAISFIPGGSAVQKAVKAKGAAKTASKAAAAKKAAAPAKKTAAPAAKKTAAPSQGSGS